MNNIEKLKQMTEISRQTDRLAYSFIGTMIGLIEIQELPGSRSYADFLKNCIERKLEYQNAHAQLMNKFNSISNTPASD